MTSAEIAKMCHQAVFAYDTSAGTGITVPWDALTESQRAAAAAEAQFLRDAPDAGAPQLHAARLTVLMNAGRSFGDGGEPELLTWAELSSEERTRLAVFVAVARAAPA